MSTTVAFDTGGLWGLGADYLGRPVAPQLIEGGRTLLLASLASAALAQLCGVGIGLWLTMKPWGYAIVRFALDLILILPMIVVSLVFYAAAGASIMAVIPLAALLTVPFTSRYYQAAATPLVTTGFFEQALVAGDRPMMAVIREVLPVLKRVILVEFGYSTITAIYILATVSFLGTQSEESGFLWSAMVSQNLVGFALNPWSVLAPLVAIIAVTLPLNMLIDSVREQRS
ncbi:ABC transporter permease subunit [Corynebacterium sp. LK2510]|uniref:ABC transporter permease subunit n=1 Tax=Corynebacterium sp. LK2510 TaxID=3110472 RepID=UPI0034D00D55